MTDSGVALSGGGSASSSTGAFGDGPDRRARVLSHMRVSIVVSMIESSASAVALGAISSPSASPSQAVPVVQENCKHANGCVRSATGNTKDMCKKHGGKPRCTHVSVVVVFGRCMFCVAVTPSGVFFCFVVCLLLLLFFFFFFLLVRD